MSSAAIRGGRVSIEIGADAKRFYAALNAMSAKMRSVGASIASVGSRIAFLGAGASLPFYASAKAAASFQDSMAAVGAVSGATSQEFAALTAKAMELGTTTSYSAQQVADAMTVLAQGGFSAQESIDAVGGVLNLARTGMMDLAAAADIAVSTLRAFKMNASDAGKVSDVLAKAAMVSNATIADLGESLSVVSGIAAGVGASLEEVSSMLAVLADRGQKGSIAGTGLRRVFIALAQEQEKIKKLGVDVKDPKTGKLRSAIEVIKDLRVAMQGMDDVDKLDKLSKIFDVFGANAVFNLMNAGDAMDSMLGEMNAAGGSAADVAKKMDDTLGGSMRLLASATTALAIQVGNALSPSLRDLMTYVRDVIAGMTDYVTRNGEAVVAAARWVSSTMAAGAALVVLGGSLQLVGFGLGGFAKAIAIVLSPLSLLLNTSSMIVRSFGAFASLAAPIATATASLITFATAATVASVRYLAALGVMVGNTIVSMASIAAAWIGAAVASMFAFVAHVKALVTYYTGAMASMMAITITRTGAMAAAWISQAAVGVLTFVGHAVVSIASYLGSLGVAVVATIGGCAAMAAAWLAPVAPILALGGAIAGIGVSLQEAFAAGGSVASSIGALFGPMSEGFNAVLADATKVFSDLWGIANTTFAGISDALMAGDMNAAMDVLWAGLKASWLRGQQGIMSYLDAFIEGIQNVWGNAVTFLSTSILQGMGMIERGWIQMTGTLSMAWQASIDGIMGIWDTAVGAIQKAIAYIRSFFDESIDYDAIANQIDAANAQRSDARRQGRDQMDAEKNRRLQESQATQDGAVQIVQDQNAQAQAERAQRTTERAAERQRGVDSANADLAASRDQATGARQGNDLMRSISTATSVEELRAAWEEAQALAEAGLISTQKLAEIEDKIDAQTEELDKTRALRAQEEESAAKAKTDAEKAAKGAGDASAKVETAGTFSAAAAGMIGYQQTIAERTAKATEQTARNTKPREGARVQS